MDTASIPCLRWTQDSPPASIPCAYHGHSIHPVVTMDTTSIPCATMDTGLAIHSYYGHSIHPVCLPWTQHPSRVLTMDTASIPCLPWTQHPSRVLTMDTASIPCAYHGHRTGNPLLPRTQHSPPSSSIQFTGRDSFGSVLSLWLLVFVLKHLSKCLPTHHRLSFPIDSFPFPFSNIYKIQWSIDLQRVEHYINYTLWVIERTYNN